MYEVKISSFNNMIGFRFNRCADMMSFIETVLDTVNGMDTGNAKIMISMVVVKEDNENELEL